MNEYRCETCKDILCKCNPKQDGIQFSPNWIFTRKYGCASHSDYQSERDCPVCGGGLMCHRWCIDRDCGWDSVKGTPAGTLTMTLAIAEQRCSTCKKLRQLNCIYPRSNPPMEFCSEYDKMLDTIFDDGRWKINREDGGMGEKDYYIFLNDVFVASTDSEDMARRIVRTMKMNEAVGL